MAHLYILGFSSGKLYAGISEDAAKRFKEHRKCALRPGSSRDYPVYNAWRKHGEPSMQVIYSASMEAVKAMEQYVIEALALTDRANGYNLSLGGDTDPKLSPEVMSKFRAKMAKVHADPAYQEKVYGLAREHCVRLNSDPAVRKAASDRMKAFNADPEFRAKSAKASSERMKTRASNPYLAAARNHGHAMRWARNRNIPFSIWRD